MESQRLERLLFLEVSDGLLPSAFSFIGTVIRPRSHLDLHVSFELGKLSFDGFNE